jgi:3',5'-cyclic AMP phosphodiesterase CpdA
MRALVISDSHLGAWTGDDLLAYQWAREALRPELERADEVVLLGDFVDLLFSTTEHAFARADGLVELLAQTLAGKRLVWLAGNHDHHVLVRRLEALIELRIATGKPDAELLDQWQASFFFEAFLRRRLPDTEVEIAYPTRRVGEVMLSHGHYLDGEVRGSVPNRLLQGGFWRIAGGRVATPTVEDYEAALVPLTELLFVEAQLPKGAAAERRIQAELRRIGHLAGIAAAPGRELARLGRSVAQRLRGRPDPQAPAADYVLARVVEPGASVLPAVRAFARVCRNLGWDKEARWFVFAHTHQPLDGVSAGDTSVGPLFWNTGCWIYEPPAGAAEDYLGYLENNWPGSAVVIDTEERGGEPQLLELLAADRTALRARFHGPDPPIPEQLRRYEDVRRLLGRG